MKREVVRAVKAAGSVKKLAEQLGVNPSTVYRWRKHGVPKRGNARAKLSDYQEQRRRERQFRETERSTFEELLKEAGDLERLPARMRSGKRKREGARTEGVRHTLAIERLTNRRVLEKVLAWARSLPTNPAWPVWQAQIQTTQYTLPELSFHGGLKGYRTVGSVQQMSHARSGDFSVGEVWTGPKHPSKREATSDLMVELEALDDASELLVLVHHVTLFNYRQRPEAERRQWETTKRKEREKQWERKQRTTEKQSKKRKSKKTSPKILQVPKKPSRKKTTKKTSQASRRKKISSKLPASSRKKAAK